MKNVWIPIRMRGKAGYMIKVRRVYEAAIKEEGMVYLVDRLWPRGIKKEKLKIDGWLKEAAPSDSLRSWYHHEPERWNDFCERYYAELETKHSVLVPLLEAAQKGVVTLLYSARDTQYNNAIALKNYIDVKLKK
jgi:uncharacterized protein YeaO (DUF488 family)